MSLYAMIFNQFSRMFIQMCKM